MKVSIVMPLYNSAKYLEEAIDSVIAQTFTDWELLVVNELGSDDGSREIVEKYAKKDSRVVLIQNDERLGISASMNRAIDVAKGEYIARMDADDIALPQRFEKQIAFLEANKDIAACGTRVEIFGDNKFEWELETDANQIGTNILFYSPCVHPTFMVRKSLLDEHNIRYNNAYTATEDYDFFANICKVGKIANVDEVLFRYRIMNNNATFRNNDKGIRIYSEIMMRQFEELGLSFTQSDVELLSTHISVKQMAGKDVYNAVIKAEVLLQKIFIANEKKHIYDRYCLWRTLCKRYNEICAQAKWECKRVENAIIDRLATNSIFSRAEFYRKSQCGVVDGPLVSVLLPTYNSENYLLGSLWSILEQTYQNFEILLLNEVGSDDDTIFITSIFDDERIKVIQNTEKLGLADSLNYGIKVANGKYLARMDADDMSIKERLRLQVEFLEAHPDYGICGGWQAHFGVDTDWVHKHSSTYEDIKAELIYNCDLCHSTLMLRKDMFIENNLFYNKEKFAEDYELWTRAVDLFKIANLPAILGTYRVGTENITAKKMDLLSKESGELSAANIKRYFDIDVPADLAVLLNGWRNEYNTLPSGKKKECYRKEEELLRNMVKQNQVLKRIDEDSLLKTINKRWRFVTNTWREDGMVYDLDTLFSEFKADNIVKAKAKSAIGKMSVKKVAKNILKKPYHAIKWRTVGEIENHIWDLEGHLKDEITKAKEEAIKEIDSHIKNSVSAIVSAIVSEIVSEIVHKEIDRAITEINNKTDTRIWMSELRVEKQIDTMSWNVDRKLRAILKEDVSTEGLYNEFFYLDNQCGSYKSATFVLREIIPVLGSESVIDFGCGTGTWACVAKELGAKEVRGVDGDYVNRKMLMIDEDEFTPADLSKSFDAGRKYDLAMSLEVAEHIDEKYADIFIDSICSHADIILFSAAHPGQGGTEHVNEQEIEYWQEKFKLRGYDSIDIRPAFKDNYKIESWYRENMNLYVKKERMDLECVKEVQRKLSDV